MSSEKFENPPSCATQIRVWLRIIHVERISFQNNIEIFQFTCTGSRNEKTYNSVFIFRNARYAQLRNCLVSSRKKELEKANKNQEARKYNKKAVKSTMKTF